MRALITQIIARYEALDPTVRVHRWDPYFVHANIRAKHEALWLSCSQRGTVRLEYIDICGDTTAELILSADRTLVELFGRPDKMGLLVYVAERILTDLDDRFHSDPDVIGAKQSETYRALADGETNVLSVIYQMEPERL